MKKICSIALWAFLLASACTKTDVSDKSSLSQTISNEAIAPDLSKCKIRRIYQFDIGDAKEVTALFTYTKAGNPFSVVYSNGGTGVNDHHFFYDSKNRLKEYQQSWVGYITSKHVYTHNAVGQIIKDSITYWNCCGVLDKIDVSTIEYDSKGRVVKETIVNKFYADGELFRTSRPTYTYDARGNLAVAGWKSSSYDNKINPLRQSPVFQFIFRNYSMNNSAVQPKYNSIGLPLSMKPTNRYFFNHPETTKVIYDCQ